MGNASGEVWGAAGNALCTPCADAGGVYKCEGAICRALCYCKLALQAIVHTCLEYFRSLLDILHIATGNNDHCCQLRHCGVVCSVCMHWLEGVSSSDRLMRTIWRKDRLSACVSTVGLCSLLERVSFYIFRRLFFSLRI